jgi:hypothetical protein
MTDFRALCDELLEALYYETGATSGDWTMLRAKAEAALAQPEPQGPTDEELQELANGFFTSTEFHFVDFARAVLARWGRPAIEPVPVVERLPRPEDCDAEGRCWLTSVDVEPGWVADNPEQCTNWTHWLPHRALPVPQAQ